MDKVDPAEEAKKQQEDEQLLEDMQSFDLSGLKATDFKSIPKRMATASHPFDGYPLKPEVEIGRKANGHKIMVSATYIVGLTPDAVPPQDSSGRGISIIDTKTKKERRVDLKTAHSRLIPIGPNTNEDVVFDRIFELTDGDKIFYAVVRGHAVRAQLMFFFNSKLEKVEVDPRYRLLDDGQNSRLRTLFHQIINPKLRREKMASEVAGEIETSDESLKKLPTE